MTKFGLLIVLAVVLILGGAGAWYWTSSTEPAPVPTATTTPQQTTGGETPTPASKDDLIVVNAPLPNGEVTSPLTVTGRARGSWYFEAQFPVKLYDANGKLLASAPATAQGEWMTTEYVPFSVTLTFSQPTTATGRLVLEKDNPSGLAEHANQLEVPVRFGTANGTAVKLYYYNPALDQSQCTSAGLVAVDRSIPKTSTPLTDTVRLLLKGELTATEKNRGLTPEFPLTGVTLTQATVSNGVATLTFSDPQNKLSGGSCRVSVLRAELEATAKQFPTVTSVVFKPTSILQP